MSYLALIDGEGRVVEVFPEFLNVEGTEVPLLMRYHPDLIERMVPYDPSNPPDEPPLPTQKPLSVSQRQGRLALVEAGLYAQVLALIDAIADPVERLKAQIEWDAPTYERHSPFLLQMWALLGKGEHELDALFTDAAGR